MNFQVLGWSYRQTPLELRERLAFSREQAAEALRTFRERHPGQECVLLSTCNRTELYQASTGRPLLCRGVMLQFIAEQKGLNWRDIRPTCYHLRGEDAIRHILSVASSLDSMVLGESQITAQVKQAYLLAAELQTAGPVIHTVFQAALRTAGRVASETTIHQRRVSVPSVAVSEFAHQIFERFDDKLALVIGAGEMAEETLRYLQEEGVHKIIMINRHHERACELAQRWGGIPRKWEELIPSLKEADIVVSTTGAQEPIVTLADFHEVERARCDRPLFILDLAVPRDFDPAIGQRPGVYLFSIDDLKEICERNRRARDAELPLARKIIEAETRRLLADHFARQYAPVITRLREEWQEVKRQELRRLLHRLPNPDEHTRKEVERAFDRLINKLLHPPLESIRHESQNPRRWTLLEALTRLFQLREL